jgi:IS4 transposase
MGRSTITGWLVSSGLQFKDWSASYKLFSQSRINNDVLFSVIRQEVVNMNDKQEDNIYAHMDDTLFRKRGKKVSGTKWLRDPLGPPFHTNFVWGQRFLQISLSSYKKAGAVQSKTIPIDLVHCPLPVKPKKGSDGIKIVEYKEQQKKMKLSKIGYERINLLRENLNSDGHTDKRLVISVDGSYTNETVLKNLSPNTTLIGRIRKDAKLNKLPTPNEKGRKKVYGEALPTPEQIRQSEDYPWQEVEGWACGKVHTFNVKILSTVRWRKAGTTNLQLVIIKPIAYRLSMKSNRLYRDPIYLICTDTKLSIEKLLQAYLWRWGIEVNFKEQKTFLGCGKAQVRTEESCQNVPAFHTAVYSLLLTASAKENHQELPRPKWYRKNKTSPATTGDILNQFKAASWAENMAIDYSNFIKLEQGQRSRKNSPDPNLSAVLYRRN